MSDALHTWDGEESPIAIEYSLVAIEEIRQQAAHGLAKLSRIGIETGGILYGSRDGRKVRIEAMRPIASAHAAGPSFVLSLADRTVLEEQLAKNAEDPSLRKFTRVGWFISRTRGELAMNESDREIFSKYLPETWQVTLVIRPGRMNATKGVFFVREPDGSIHESSREFDFPDRLAGLRSAPPRVGRVSAAVAGAAAAAHTPVPMPVPMSLQRPVARPEPAILPEPFIPMEPIAPMEPIVQQEPVVQAELVVPVEPVVQVEPVVKVAPPVEVQPDTPPEPVVQVAPLVIAAPAPEPVSVSMAVQAAVSMPVHAEVQTPETEPSHFESSSFSPSAFSPLLVPTQTSTRWRWIAGGAAVLLGIIVLATTLWQSSPPEPLGLAVTEREGQLQIEWSTASKSVQKAVGGSLSILDGSNVQRIALSRDRLSKGRYLYAREGGDVEVRMEVDGDGETVRESSRFLARTPVPVAPVDAAVPAATPAPAPSAVRAPMPPAVASSLTRETESSPAAVEENRRLKTENGKLRERIQQLERTQRILESRIGITAAK